MILVPQEWEDCGEGIVGGFVWRFLLATGNVCVRLERFRHPSKDGFGWSVYLDLPGKLVGFPHDQYGAEIGICSLPATLDLPAAKIEALAKAAGKLRALGAMFNELATRTVENDAGETG